MKIVYTDDFRKQFCYWKEHNKKIVEKIENLIISISQNPFKGIGKPELLCFQLSGCWSRRINREHRLVYKIEKEQIILISCQFHYD